MAKYNSLNLILGICINAVCVAGCDSTTGTKLIANLESRLDPTRVRELLMASQDQWVIIEDSRLPIGDQRPRFDILRIRIEKFSHSGETGPLELTFFNDQLARTCFYPSNISSYKRTLERTLHIEFKKKFSAFESEIGSFWEARIRPKTLLWICEDYKRRQYVGWEDEVLAAEMKRWVRQHS